MDVAVLMNDARTAGLTLSIDAGRLVVEGPTAAARLAKQLVANKEDVLAMLESERDATVSVAEGLRAGWRGACSEIAELCGWPALPFAAGRSVAVGPSPWRRFIRNASVPDLQLVLAALRDLVAALPDPSIETKEDAND